MTVTDKCMARNDVWDLGKSRAKSSAAMLFPCTCLAE